MSDLETVWMALEDGVRENGRIYRRLDLERETGIRVCISNPGKKREILVEVTPTDLSGFNPPGWKGMDFQVVQLDIPDPGTYHVILSLEDPAQAPIFATVSSEIVEVLSESELDMRLKNLQACIDRWTKFFQRHGLEGLSEESQRGLYGELAFMEMCLAKGMDSLVAVTSWEGCGSGCHDFEWAGKAVEVKTTLTKEPRRVVISSERQLDGTGFEALNLFVLTLHQVDSGARTLPELVDHLREVLSGNSNALYAFETHLREAGFLDIHRGDYGHGYIILKLESFTVTGGFPRITSVPAGVGDLSYSLTLSACSGFETPSEQVVKSFSGAR